MRIRRMRFGRGWISNDTTRSISDRSGVWPGAADAAMCRERAPVDDRCGVGSGAGVERIDAGGAFDRYRRAMLWNPARPGEPEENMVGFLSTLAKAGHPHGKRFHYVSPNSDMLGLVVERAAGVRFPDYLAERLWGPMGATGSAYVTVDRAGSSRAAGGICITVADLARLGQLILDGGRTAEGAQVIPPAWIEMHKRMRAKLFAFLEPPGRTFQRYRDSDASLDSRYARAIAAYRKPDMATALPLIDGLIAERPNDPYFHELKGQMLFENGRGREAIAPYRRAVELLPDSALLHLGLAQALIEQEDAGLLDEAQEHLTIAAHHEPQNSQAWRLLSIAYGREGDEGMAAYAMAEYALLTGRVSDAEYHAGKAERLLPKASPSWLRVQDIKQMAEEAKREQKRDR